MTKVGEKYKCTVCTNVVSVIRNGVGTLVCCDKPMELVIEQTATSAVKMPEQPASEITAEPKTEIKQEPQGVVNPEENQVGTP